MHTAVNQAFSTILGGGVDLIIAFFPCIYFTGSTNPRYFTLENNNYRKLTLQEKICAMIKRTKEREYYYEILIKFVGVCLNRNIRLIIENPYSSLHFLCNNFFKKPDILDKDRTIRGDYFKKPTGYWFFGCEPTIGMTIQKDKLPKKVFDCKSAGNSGICSEERSMISADYARNFICDNIIGKTQAVSQLSLF